MEKHIYLLIILLSFGYKILAQTYEDPNNAVHFSHEFDQSQGRINFYSDNRDFCDYYLYIFFKNAEGFEGMPSRKWITVTRGRQQILTYRVKAGATRYSYNYQFVTYRGDYSKKPNIDFVYSLPIAAKEALTAWIVENPEGYQLAFDLSADTIYACRSGVMCNDNLKDFTAKGYKHFNNNRTRSQITLYHSDGSFGEYVFEGKSLVYPGEKVKIGSPIAVVDRTSQHALRFSVYFLDKNKLNNEIGNKHTHFRPFFQTVNEGKTRLEDGKTYLGECTDEMLMQDMSKREKKNVLNKR